MAGPIGATEIFTSVNVHGFSRNATVSGPSEKRVAKGTFETGTCAGMSALYLSKAKAKGPARVTKSDVGATGDITANSHRAAIAQAAYEFGTISHGKTVLDDRKSLLEAFNLTPVESIRKVFNQSMIIKTLTSLKGKAGYYFIGTPSHNMAMVIQVNSALFFDPDEGLYQWNPIGNFVSNLSHYLLADYSVDVGKYMEIIKVS